MNLYYYSEELGIEEKYKAFLKAYYGERFEYKWARFRWYSRNEGFKVLLAEVDGELVGQSCAFRSKLMIGGREREIYWGADGFVLTEWRGKGVGKALQKKLHDDLEGFSSTSYSSVNGHIKRKCGSHPISTTNFSYYPISTYFTLYLGLGLGKLLGRGMGVVRIPGLYVKRRLAKRLVVETAKRWSVDDVQFVNKVLAERYDMYVCRDAEYLKWKYDENPYFEYNILKVYRYGDRVAIAAVSGPYKKRMTGITLNNVKILDFFNPSDSGLSDRQLLNAIKTWVAGKYDGVDVLMGITELDTPLRIKYHSRQFLTNLKGIPRVKRPYVSCMDQDVEQLQ